MSLTRRHSFREVPSAPAIGATLPWNHRSARRDLQAVLPELGAIGLEDLADDSGQTETDLLAECLTVGLSEQCVPGYCEEGVVGGPDLEVGAVLVELEHKVVERGEERVQTGFAFAQSLRRLEVFASFAHNTSPGLRVCRWPAPSCHCVRVGRADVTVCSSARQAR